MKKLIIGLVAVLVVGGVASILWPSANRTSDLTFINYQDAFNQAPAEYFVYFYNTDCRFCQQLEPFLMEAYRAGVPIFVVDVVDPANASVRYDWVAHDERHTTVVGEVVDGENVWFEEFNPEDFSGDEGWIVTPRGDELVAMLDRAVFNPTPATPEEIEVTGTPSMMHVINGRAVLVDIGVDESKAMLASYSGVEGLFE